MTRIFRGNRRNRIGTHIRFEPAFPTSSTAQHVWATCTNHYATAFFFLIQFRPPLHFLYMHAHVSILISHSCWLWGLELMNSVYTPADQCTRCRITDTSGMSPLPLPLFSLFSSQPCGDIQQLPDVKSHLHREKGSM